MNDHTPWPAAPTGLSGPLAGLKVLDLSRVLAGPLASMQLGDLGADVIKVETPGHGDETRHFGPPFLPDGNAAYYAAVNRNKRSITLDLSSPPDAETARWLARHADVMVDNFLPGRMARFGLDPAALRAENPGLITATISGFGTDNDYSGRPGFDFLAQAMGGVMAITGPAGGEPTRVGVAIVDLMAGLHATNGILAALTERHATGQGRHVDVALLDTSVSMLVNLAMAYLAVGVTTPRFGNAHPSIAPYETLAVADGEIALAVGTDRQFRHLADQLGLPELADDPRFATNRDRVRHRPALRHLLEERLTTETRRHWLEVLIPAGVPAAPVNELPDVFADPVIRERMLDLSDYGPQVRSPIRLDHAPLPIVAQPPGLGQHNQSIRAR